MGLNVGARGQKQFGADAGAGDLCPETAHEEV
ncbi:hypothetical protein J2753_000452 [Halolamina salifodinae]|uniref:Uncharacterized protein n=1 Tax=Halolamina salifodinae TaxID=1202767 RepID=A0A8T4GSX3_9EURY|nr:hypothetical protein [Halolamina salifodinae]